MQKRGVIILILATLLVVDFSYGQGCSQCKLLAEQGTELDEASFGSNINSCILYLMAMPYIILLIVFHKRIIAFFKSKLAK